jgi:AcrR family transcriptional regulator
MARPSTLESARKKLLPIVARTFSELGYRRTTTAELSRRCAVQEPILYRFWNDMMAMFLDAVALVYECSEAVWTSMIRESKGTKGVAARLLDYEARHHGEFGLYRIVFAGLGESDDPQISKAVADMYRKFHRFLTAQVALHRKGRRGRRIPSEGLAAWGLVGLGTVANVIRELGLATSAERGRFFTEVGRFLLDGRSSSSGSHSEDES